MGDGVVITKLETDDAEKLLAQMTALFDGELARLRSENEDLKVRLAKWEQDELWRWTQHRLIYVGDYPPELPIPRLQNECVRTHAGAVWRYELIYLNYVDEIMAVPIGETRISGYDKPTPGEIAAEPFRERFHIRSDAAQLNLPAFKVEKRGDEVLWERLGTVEQMRRGDG